MIITMSSTLFCSIQSCKKLVSSNDNLSERTHPLTNTKSTKKDDKKDILGKIVQSKSSKKHEVIHPVFADQITPMFLVSMTRHRTPIGRSFLKTKCAFQVDID